MTVVAPAISRLRARASAIIGAAAAQWPRQRRSRNRAVNAIGATEMTDSM